MVRQPPACQRVRGSPLPGGGSGVYRGLPRRRVQDAAQRRLDRLARCRRLRVHEAVRGHLQIISERLARSSVREVHTMLLNVTSIVLVASALFLGAKLAFAIYK